MRLLSRCDGQRQRRNAKAEPLPRRDPPRADSQIGVGEKRRHVVDRFDDADERERARHLLDLGSTRIRSADDHGDRKVVPFEERQRSQRFRGGAPVVPPAEGDDDPVRGLLFHRWVGTTGGGVGRGDKGIRRTEKLFRAGRNEPFVTSVRVGIEILVEQQVAIMRDVG